MAAAMYESPGKAAGRTKLWVKVALTPEQRRAQAHPQC
jgi:hypothetical protein